ncbi:MAG: hypothetical protein IJX13_08235, partial [Clostridia bacterium]|nr:hypothetical protein [Clostridia bacterium]
MQEPTPSVVEESPSGEEKNYSFFDFKAEKNETKKLNVFALCKRIALLAVAVLMLVMSFFPVFQMQFEVSNIEIPVMLTPIDNFVFFIDSFQSLEGDELTDTRLYEDLLDISEEYDEEMRRIAEEKDLSLQSLEYDDLSGYAKGLMNRAAILGMRLTYQSEEVSPSPMSIIIAVLSLLYILLCVALVVVSVLHLLLELGILKATKNFGSKSTVALLCAVPMMLVLLYLAMFFCYAYGMAGASLAWAGVVTVVSFTILFAGLITYRFAVLQHRPRLSSIIKHGLSAAVAVVLLFLLICPVFSITLDAVFTDKNNKREESFSTNASFFENLHLTEIERESCEAIYDEYKMYQFENLMEGHFDTLDSYKAKDFREGKAALANRQLLIDLGSAAGMHEFYWLFYLICIFYLLISVGACLSLWCHMTWFAGGNYRYVVDRVAKYT